MAHSLRHSKFDRILLLTPDVPPHVTEIIRASGFFKELIQVNYIMGHSSLFKKDWFREVFTKFHIFNQTQFDRIIFLDLDMAVRDVSAMDALFDLDIQYGAMENSKHEKSGSMWLSHGESMGRYCRLINAGLILVRPNQELFNILLTDVTSDSPDHVPGMTPEQFYLARVMGEHFKHIAQRYNFEVQLHGGVPRTSSWDSLSFEEIVCFHFSGGQPLKRITAVGDPDWGCQTEKRMIHAIWNSEIEQDIKDLANERARKAFGFWAYNFALACKQTRSVVDSNFLLQYGHSGEKGLPSSNLMIGDLADGNLIAVRVDPGGILTVDPESFALSFKPVRKPSRPAPSLPTPRTVS